MLSRSYVCQSVLDLKAESKYLEIGVNQGITFHEIRAARKVAVDPAFLFDMAAARAEHPHCEYYQVTSDEYFATLDPTVEYDVIFLDGMHTAEQTLRDLLNALDHVKTCGVIIIDDVKPTSYAASLSNVDHANLVKKRAGDQDQAWMGDVYKLVWFIDTFLQRWSFRTVSENHGQVVMWRSQRDARSIPQRLIHDIGGLSLLRWFSKSTRSDLLASLRSFR